MKERSGQMPEVGEFRQIFHLPLIFQGDGAFNSQAVVNKLVKDGKWEPVQAVRPEDEGLFAEYVYFHDFVRDFLYPNPDSDKPAFRLLHVQNPSNLVVRLSEASPPIGLKVERQTLHVFETGALVLTVEVLVNGKLSLPDAMQLVDKLRRSYVPYWDDKGLPGGVPHRIDFQGPDDEAPCASPVEATIRPTKEECAAHLHAHISTGQDAPIIEPWETWLEGIDLATWRDPSDERVPVMSFIVLAPQEGVSARDTMKAIKDSEWAQLAEADGQSEHFLYNPVFLEQKEKIWFYDRFFPHEDMDDKVASRHVFGGAHYAFVTVSGSMTDLLRTHFTRHYAQIGLIVRFEIATLLAFSSQLTELVSKFDRDPKRDSAEYRFRKDLVVLRQRFLRFVHRFHFTGVSSQIQPTEMLSHWRASTGLDDLFEDVSNEINSAGDFATTLMAQDEAEAANRIATAATYLAILGLPAALLAMPVFDAAFVKRLVSDALCDGQCADATKLALWGLAYVELSVASMCAFVLFSRVWGKKR